MQQYTIDQRWGAYTPEEHATWKTLFERQLGVLEAGACRAFAQALRTLPIGPACIPDLAQLNPLLDAATGWTVVAVPGLVPDEVFFRHLARREFPAGRFIRAPHQLDYLQEPDIFHDIFGHVPMLMHPAMGDFMQAYGEGGLRAMRLGVLEKLARVYWYTVEFGLVEEDDQLRIYGSGIASSFAECNYCLHSPVPQRLRFDLHRVLRTDYRIDDFQACYFVLDHFDQLLDLAQIDFAPYYARAAACEVLHPAASLPTDRVCAPPLQHLHRAGTSQGPDTPDPGVSGVLAGTL